MISVDLNADLGESREPAQRATDLALLDIVTSANIACGGHAGDEETMAATVEAALVRGVAVGAHPGYPDRANFGRVAMDVSNAELQAFVLEQVATLARVLGTQGGHPTLTHIKLHGALYHRAMTHEPTALAVAAAVRRFESSPDARSRPLLMVAMPLTLARGLWTTLGHTVVTEFFADRAYELDGSLRSRTLPGALINDPAAAAEQAVKLAIRFTAGVDGVFWPIGARRPGIDVPAEPSAPPSLTICIHSDTPGAVGVAGAVRAGLEHAGFAVRGPRMQ